MSIKDTLAIPYYAYGDNQAACEAFSALRKAAAEIERWESLARNHAESLRAIRDMCGAEPVDIERIRLWATDSLSGYTEPLESSMLQLSDERNRLRAALRWAYDRLDVDGGMTEREQRRTVEEIGKTLVGEPSSASDYRPDSDEASMRRERGQWPT